MRFAIALGCTVFYLRDNLDCVAIALGCTCDGIGLDWIAAATVSSARGRVEG